MKKKFAYLLALALSISPLNQVYAYNMPFLYGGTEYQYNNYASRSENYLDSVSPDYFHLTNDGNLKENNIDKEFISKMHSKNIAVIPFVSNYFDRNKGIAALNSYRNLAVDIAEVIKNYNLDGVNIDINNLTQNSKKDYTDFIKEVKNQINDKTLIVSVAANPERKNTGWYGSYDYKNIGKTADYVVLLCFDESYYKSEPGPVAALDFVEKSVENLAKQVPNEKIILGIPFYGRFWKEGEQAGGSGITNMDIESLMKNYKTEKTFGSDNRINKLTVTIEENDIKPKIWGGYVLEDGKYDIYFDDEIAVKEKLNIVNEYNLKGIAPWALGQESKSIWNVFGESNFEIVEREIENQDIAPVMYTITEGISSKINSEEFAENVTKSWKTEEKFDQNNNKTRIETITIETTDENYSSENQNNTNNNINSGTNNNSNNLNNAIDLDSNARVPLNQDIYNNDKGNLQNNAAGNNSNLNNIPTNDFNNQSPNNGILNNTNGNANTNLNTNNPYNNNFENAPNLNNNTGNFGNINNTGGANTDFNNMGNNSGGLNNTTPLNNRGGNLNNNFNNMNTGGGINNGTPNNTNTNNLGTNFSTTNNPGNVNGNNNSPLTALDRDIYAQNLPEDTDVLNEEELYDVDIDNQMAETDEEVIDSLNQNEKNSIIQSPSEKNILNSEQMQAEEKNILNSEEMQVEEKNTLIQQDNNEKNLLDENITDGEDSDIKNELFDDGFITKDEYYGNELLTRGQFIKTIMRMAGDLNENPEKEYFVDLSNYADADLLERARHYGIIKADDRYYRPDENIAKSEVFLTLEKVFSLPNSVNFNNDIISDISRQDNSDLYYTANKFYELGLIELDSNNSLIPNSLMKTDEFVNIVSKIKDKPIKNIIPNVHGGQSINDLIISPR